MVARSRTRPPTLTSSTCRPHEITAPEFAVDREVEQGEVAGSALHLEPDPDRPHVLGLYIRGRFCPIRRPLFQGSRRGTDGRLLSSMIVSSKPTAPSRLRSAEGRRGILSRGGRKTRPWFIG